MKKITDIYGNPLKSQEQRETFENAFMELWDVPPSINAAIPALPNKIYCNDATVKPLELTFRELISRNLHQQIKTWDGCYNPRLQRGSRTRISTHTWGLAIDMNAAWNGLGRPVQWSDEFVQVWRDMGWICGADFKGSRIDGMHFERTKGLINE